MNKKLLNVCVVRICIVFLCEWQMLERISTFLHLIDALKSLCNEVPSEFLLHFSASLAFHSTFYDLVFFTVNNELDMLIQLSRIKRFHKMCFHMLYQKILLCVSSSQKQSSFVFIIFKRRTIRNICNLVTSSHFYIVSNPIFCKMTDLSVLAFIRFPNSHEFIFNCLFKTDFVCSPDGLLFFLWFTLFLIWSGIFFASNISTLSHQL